MSHSAFKTKQMEVFKSRFRQADGWQVYTTEKAIFHRLPRLLEKFPEAVKYSDVMRGLRHETTYPERQDSPCFSMKDRGWLGTYELNWKGEPVSVRAFSHKESYPLSHYLLAARSQEAAHRLYLDLLEFCRETDRQAAVTKVNTYQGEDIILTASPWEDLILPSTMLEDLRTGVETFFKSRDEYRRFGVPYKRGFIFSGPAGCGKTLAAKTIIYNTRIPSYLLTGSSDPEETQRAIDWAFDSATEDAPAILVIEELEKFSEAAYVSSILNLMDGVRPVQGVLVIATTNHPEKIAPELLLRPSRFDRVWQFPLPDESGRLRFLQKKAKGSFADSLLAEVARLSAGFSMAYVQELFASALTYAVREGRSVRGEDLLKSVEALKKQIKAAPLAAAEMLEAEKRLGFSQV